MSKQLYIVYTIDTEGPLHEPLMATFDRLKEIFNLDIPATKENLSKLQNQQIDLSGQEKDVAKVLSPHLLAYNDTWDKIDKMLDKIMPRYYRDSFQDDFGRGIVYNWHCMDHVGFETNERRRDIGYGNIYKHYTEKIEEHGGTDRIHWHFHPVPFDQEAHIPATSYDNSMNVLHQIITRRVIDHDWFPVVNRAGFHTIRQDSSWFLEQWIPFDYSNQSEYDDKMLSYNDLGYGRFGDWRRAPKTWKPYHPAYDDYQTPGCMRRYTTKCLNVGTRSRLLTDHEIRKAFELADAEGKAIMSFTNHDFRDMDIDIQEVYSRIFNIAKEFSDVEVLNCDAIEAMQRYLYTEEEIADNQLSLGYKIEIHQGVQRLLVVAERGNVFGPQPYLAIKTKDGRYLFDNFDEDVKGESWSYIFDRITLPVDRIDQVKVAANDKYGHTEIIEIDLVNGN